MSQLHIFLNKSRNDKGYIALMSVLIISAVGAIVALSLLTVGTSLKRTSFTEEEAYHAKAMATLCANKALMGIRLSASYKGNEDLDFEAGDCTILPITIVGTTYTIQVEGVADAVVSRSKVVVERMEDPDTFVVTVHINSFEEVADL